MADDVNISAVLSSSKGIVEAVPVYPDAVQPAAKEFGEAAKPAGRELGEATATVARAINAALKPLKALV